MMIQIHVHKIKANFSRNVAEARPKARAFGPDRDWGLPGGNTPHGTVQTPLGFSIGDYSFYFL
jgi:hypothetical protein